MRAYAQVTDQHHQTRQVAQGDKAALIRVARRAYRLGVVDVPMLPQRGRMCLSCFRMVVNSKANSSC